MALNAIITYIGKHYTERIRIEDLAKTVSYSPGTCCRIFRKRLGVIVRLQQCLIDQLYLFILANIDPGIRRLFICYDIVDIIQVSYFQKSRFIKLIVIH